MVPQPTPPPWLLHSCSPASTAGPLEAGAAGPGPEACGSSCCTASGSSSTSGWKLGCSLALAAAACEAQQPFARSAGCCLPSAAVQCLQALSKVHTKWHSWCLVYRQLQSLPCHSRRCFVGFRLICPIRFSGQDCSMVVVLNPVSKPASAQLSCCNHAMVLITGS